MDFDMQRQDASATVGQPPAASKRKRADTSSSTDPTTSTSNKRQCLASSLCLPSDDAKVLSAIDARYEVQLQTVISSSKIQQRVSAMLRFLAPPTESTELASNNPPSDPTATPKTKVSVLRAKAINASKLISIAEIAKREIQKEQSKGNSAGAEGEVGKKDRKGHWYQYIALGEELQERDRVEDTVIEETVLAGAGGNQDGHDKEDDFEVMKTPFERAIEGRPLVRGVPFLSLFLSRSPIEELKKRYGEQTNIEIP
ncbi:hypothetical protein F4777DRAFT_186199 [Nemania sp. FL0916]|nr:hypothetical protein F4777DRAFT_186199 [Nemania sp. FL0916]